ncbi:extracellular catalytic domain type 1 short-chain-length polyhydroxyalkanoate depolymerase [Actinoplanes teichomyceticus]|uniref:Poly(Hydroxyalkanoate) depolymerase family esterase n=1 Tax=Actinoplanes teichomyceticus TaxID=1867 RepID=A0A561VCI1_ACTTI|nr:PHB depolymerase family esterase [Actinoplanes teichomyceticus]TWG09319.1 poly(hydroxyalkanoate) depolymerase family esterase [Actinoplanes teichomyceticus]
MRIRRKLLLAVAGALVMAGLAVPAARPAFAASLTEVTAFGSNPGGMRMHLYVPDVRPASPPIVVAMHGCGGSGPGFHSSSEFASLADRYGFLVIYPSAMQEAGFGRCFDTWSTAAKTRDGGSDPVSIASMVSYAARQYGGDLNRVYATGSSSGGMMTQHMLALYPDLFKAGASFMGVPFDCFAGAADYPPGTSRCTGGSMNRTPQQWGDAVRRVNPGHAGPRPRVQLWHGTADTLVPYQLLQESIEQWTNVFGLGQTPTSSDTPQAGWNRRRYADAAGTVQVEAYSVQGAGHTLPSSGMAAAAIAFFGLTTAPSTPPSSPPVTGACRVTDTVNAWNNGLTSTITITNSGAGSINGWSLVFTLPAGQTITSGWGATYSPQSGQVTARNVDYTAVIAPNSSISIGFQATHVGNTAKPTSFTFNGTACAVG